MIDDSALFHGTYDPVKAREYYLKTRKLKGRRRGSGTDYGQREAKQAQRILSGGSSGGKPNRANTKSRRAELQAQKEALEKRLDRLREVLSELVEAAKKRSGVKDEKDKAPETKKDKADRNKAEKKDKPETAAEKKERAKKAKEAYEKENPTSLSQDVAVLKEQVADIQAQIQKAVENARAARERRTKAGNDDKKRPAQKTNDGPRGR